MVMVSASEWVWEPAEVMVSALGPGKVFMNTFGAANRFMAQRGILMQSCPQREIKQPTCPLNLGRAMILMLPTIKPSEGTFCAESGL